ncbi:MAG: hypothetical protein AAGA40_18195 [Cyanobacteria bacterium P01_E01_bin.45]
MAMKRGDRRTSNDDNALNNPRPKQQEPATREALLRRNATLKDQKDRAKQQVKEKEGQLETQRANFLALEENYDRSQTLLQERDEKITALEAANQAYEQQLAAASQQAAISSNENFEQLFMEMRDRVQAEQQTSARNLALYKTERSRVESLQTQFSHVEAERERFVTLLEDTQETLQLERGARLEEQQTAKSNLALYAQERSRADELQAQFSYAESERERLITVCADVRETLRLERSSKVNVEEWEARVADLQAQSDRTTQLLQAAQHDLENTQADVKTFQLRYDETLGLYQQEQATAQQYLEQYEQEQARAKQLQTKYAAAESEREQLATLNLDLQKDLKKERRSKAGIKGWETRRKRENAKLKQEISEMANILQKAMAEKDTAIGELYDVANRMDRIQRLVDSVDEETSSSPMGLLQKFKLVWEAIQDIFSE